MNENEIAGRKAFKLHEHLVRLKRAVEGSGLIMGKILHEIQENELYLILGYDTFESYIADPDLSFGRSTVFNLKKNYKQWVLDYGFEIKELEEIGYDRLLEAGKVAIPRTKKKWLRKARTLSRSDLNIEVAEERGEKEDSFTPMPRMSRCKCGKWFLPEGRFVCEKGGKH